MALSYFHEQNDYHGQVKKKMWTKNTGQKLPQCASFYFGFINDQKTLENKCLDSQIPCSHSTVPEPPNISEATDYSIG